MTGNIGRRAEGDEIDTLNDCGVAVCYREYATGGTAPEVCMIAPPAAHEFIDREKALRLAAWIVVVLEADGREPADRGPSFEEILEAVRNT